MKDDKKKFAVVGALGAIVIGIGAFSFLSGGSSTPPPPPPAKKPAAPDPKDAKTIKNPEFSTALPKRDPFSAPADGDTAVTTPPKPVEKQAPASLRGNLAGTTLPAAGSSVAPIQVAPPDPVFAYRLSGLITGHRAAAVFTDASGSQRLVPLGASLDGDSQLIAVSKGRAAVKFRGKRLWLTLGGTPDAN